MKRIRTFEEYGRTGLKQYGGFIDEEALPVLKGSRGAKIFSKMADNDPIVGAVLFVVNMYLRRVSWWLEPKGESKEEQEAKDFVEGCLDDMSISWNETLSEILTMIIYGWSFLEIVYKRRLGPEGKDHHHSKFSDGKIGWRKWSPRSQNSLYRWEFDENGNLNAMMQMPPSDYQIRTIPLEKALLFRVMSTKGNPEGKSMLRNAYRPWYYKVNMEDIEAIGIERDLAGLPVIWIPPNVAARVTDEDKAAFSEYLEIVKNLRRDEEEGILMPLLYDENGNKLYDITLLSTGGRRQIDTGDIIERYDIRIAMVMLADFLLLGHEKTGTYSLGESKNKLFTQALSAILDSIAEVINANAIPRLLALNGMEAGSLPQLVHDKVEDVDLAKLGRFISDITRANISLSGDEKLENHLRTAADLPKRG